MATATTPFAGTFDADPVHSSFNFAVQYQGVSLFRGSMDDVQASFVSDDSGARLEGAAKVESISIRTPEQFRAHVLSDEFFGAEKHPEVLFRSASVDLAEDGTATVEGELTIKGITKPVTAKGTWTAPAPDAFGNTRGHLHLEGVVNRRDYEFTWDAPLPNGGSALADDITITIDAALVAQQA
jgi:polyisoprenoid-binding protein YceI